MNKTGFIQSRKSVDDYIRWRIERSLPAIQKIQTLTPLHKATALDIGCGYGALSRILSDRCKNVIGTEIDQTKLNIAKKTLKNKKNVQLIHVTNEIIPLKDNSVDVILLFDVIEHVRNPKRMISECLRVLNHSGILFVEFTPYYSIVGHHLYDFFKYPIHLFPPSYIKKKLYKQKINSFFTHQYYWDLFLSLNKLKIQTLQSYVSSLQTLEEQNIVKYPELFELNIPLLRLLGPFQDYVTMSFSGMYKKK